MATDVDQLPSLQFQLEAEHGRANRALDDYLALLSLLPFDADAVADYIREAGWLTMAVKPWGSAAYVEADRLFTLAANRLNWQGEYEGIAGPNAHDVARTLLSRMIPSDVRFRDSLPERESEIVTAAADAAQSLQRVFHTASDEALELFFPRVNADRLSATVEQEFAEAMSLLPKEVVNDCPVGTSHKISDRAPRYKAPDCPKCGAKMSVTRTNKRSRNLSCKCGHAMAEMKSVHGSTK